MRKFISALMIAMLGVFPCFAGSLLIHIHLTNGTDIVYSLVNEPKMLFGEKTITLTSLEGTIGEWDFENVESWNFADIDENDLDAVDEAKADNPQIRIEGGKITISGTDAKKVAVYDLSGRKVTPSLTTTGSTTSVSLNGFAKGAYVLKVGKNSAKFIVK